MKHDEISAIYDYNLYHLMTHSILEKVIKMNSLPNLPQKLQARGIYYGWVIIAAGTLGVIMSVPGQTMGVSVYTEFLIKSLNINRLELSLAYMCGTLTSAFLLPMAGRLMDKLGTRRMGAFASFFLALFLLLLSHSPLLVNKIETLTQWNHYWVALSMAFICFLGIRHFGQGQLTMASRTMMGRWFMKRRGFVLGISGVFVAFGFGLAPLVLTRLIKTFEWQGSLQLLSVLSFLMSAFAWATFRNSPEESGLQVDGGQIPLAGQDVDTNLMEHSFTAAEAIRTSAFWIFNFGMLAQALLVTAITFHMADIGKTNGLSSEKAFALFLPLAVVSTIADFIGGYSSDRYPLKYVLTVMQVGICTGLMGLQYLGTSTGYMITVIGFGISNGLFSLLMGAAWPKLFGRKHLGAIAGVNMSWIVAGSAVGPYLFSLGESFTGNYVSILQLSLILPLSVAVASFFLRPPSIKAS